MEMVIKEDSLVLGAEVALDIQWLHQASKPYPSADTENYNSLSLSLTQFQVNKSFLKGKI